MLPLRRRRFANQCLARSGMGNRRIHRNHRIAEHREVRPRALPINRVHGGVSRFAIPGLQAGRHVPPGGKSHNADFMRVDMPLGGPRPQGTQRALRIGQRRLAAFCVTVRRHPVGHDKQGIATGVKYRGEIAALFIQYHSLVRAARRHQQRNTVGLLRCVNGNCRSTNPGDRAIGQRGIFAALYQRFARRAVFRAGGFTAGPDRKGGERGKCRRRSQKQSDGGGQR